jgi:hypothetical protein
MGKTHRAFENNRLEEDIKRGELREDWRKIHNVELEDLYYTPHVIWLIKPWRKR